MAQLSPTNLWKSMSPCVVLAWKLGATEPRRSRGCSEGVAMLRRKWKTGEAGFFAAAVLRAVKRLVVARARGAVLVKREAMVRGLLN